MMASINHRMGQAEAQTQNLTQVLNNTQLEFHNTRAQIAGPSTHSGLPKGGQDDCSQPF